MKTRQAKAESGKRKAESPSYAKMRGLVRIFWMLIVLSTFNFQLSTVLAQDSGGVQADLTTGFIVIPGVATGQSNAWVLWEGDPNAIAFVRAVQTTTATGGTADYADRANTATNSPAGPFGSAATNSATAFQPATTILSNLVVAPLTNASPFQPATTILSNLVVSPLTNASAFQPATTILSNIMVAPLTNAAAFQPASTNLTNWATVDTNVFATTNYVLSLGNTIPILWTNRYNGIGAANFNVRGRWLWGSDDGTSNRMYFVYYSNFNALTITSFTNNVILGYYDVIHDVYLPIDFTNNISVNGVSVATTAITNQLQTTNVNLTQWSNIGTNQFLGTNVLPGLTNQFQVTNVPLTTLINSNGVNLTNLQAGNVVGTFSNNITGSAAKATNALQLGGIAAVGYALTNGVYPGMSVGYASSSDLAERGVTSSGWLAVVNAAGYITSDHSGETGKVAQADSATMATNALQLGGLVATNYVTNGANPTFTSLTLPGTVNSYVISNSLVSGVNGMEIKGTSNNTAGFLQLIGSANGTANIVLRLIGKGTIDVNDTRLLFRYNVSTLRNELWSGAGGTGTNFPLAIYTGLNTSQLVLNTNGTVSLSGALTNTGIIYAPAGIVTGNGAYYGNGSGLTNLIFAPLATAGSGIVVTPSTNPTTAQWTFAISVPPGLTNGLIPYTGAASNVDLGSKNFTTTGTNTAGYYVGNGGGLTNIASIYTTNTIYTISATSITALQALGIAVVTNPVVTTRTP